MAHADKRNDPLIIRRRTTFKANFTFRSPGGATDFTGKTLVLHVDHPRGELFAFATGAAATPTGSRFYYLDAATGRAALKISDEDTLLFSFEKHDWWIALLETGDVTTIAAGDFEVRKP